MGIPPVTVPVVAIDLGLIVSNDALHFREPIPDFRFIPAREEQEVAPGRAALAQGQGMVNLGDKTHYWYEAWGQPAGAYAWPPGRGIDSVSFARSTRSSCRVILMEGACRCTSPP